MSPKRFDVTNTSSVSGCVSIRTSHGVDQLFISRYGGIFSGNFLKNLIPEEHVVLHAVGFSYAGNTLAVVFVGPFKGKAHQAFCDAPGEDYRLNSHFLRFVGMHPATNSVILAFGIFSQAHHVKRVCLHISQRRLDAFEQPQGPKIDVLIVPQWLSSEPFILYERRQTPAFFDRILEICTRSGFSPLGHVNARSGPGRRACLLAEILAKNTAHFGEGMNWTEVLGYFGR